MTIPLSICEVVGLNPVPGDKSAFDWQAADQDGNTFLSSGREILLFRNLSADNRDVNVTSVSDRAKRTGTYMVQLHASEYGAAMFGVEGWRASDMTITVTGSGSDVEFAVLRLPTGRRA